MTALEMSTNKLSAVWRLCGVHSFQNEFQTLTFLVTGQFSVMSQSNYMSFGTEKAVFQDHVHIWRLERALICIHGCFYRLSIVSQFIN